METIHNPAISIVMPVYNQSAFLSETIESLKEQEFTDFEVICVDDGSTDNSLQMLEDCAAIDNRFVVVRQANAGAGAARNAGLLVARGDFVIFLDSDDLFSPHMLSKSYEIATDPSTIEDAEGPIDIVAFNHCLFEEDGKETSRVGVHTGWLDSPKDVFSYADCPDRIMSIINPTPWNKLYRREFLLQNSLRFEEISSTNDITFAAVSVAMAKRIAYTTDVLLRYRVGHGNTITQTKAGKLQNVIRAVESAVKQASQLPYASEIRNSIARFEIENLIVALRRYVPSFDTEQARDYYTHLHERFNAPEYATLQKDEAWYLESLYQEFDTIRRHDYETMLMLRSRKLIASITSYPARMDTIHQSIRSILSQTQKPDRVLLWLAASQFPNSEADLPQEVTELIEDGSLEIRWCEGDLMAHKKYFYALQEFSEDVVVTFDDDLTYHDTLLEHLWASYLQYPEAVSAVRAHLITMDETGSLLPYSEWIFEDDANLHEPSKQFLATGGAGALYPPHVMDVSMLDEQLIGRICPFADDLWLKTMELRAGTPVVVAEQNVPLAYIAGSQAEGLLHKNLYGGENDVQLAQIREWLKEDMGYDLFSRSIWDAREDLGRSGVRLYCDTLTALKKKVGANLAAQKRQTRQVRGQLAAKTRRARRLRSLLDAERETTSALVEENEQLRAQLQEAQKQLRKFDKTLQRIDAELQKVQDEKAYKLGRALATPYRTIRDNARRMLNASKSRRKKNP